MEPNPSCVLRFVEVGCPGCGAESGSDALWGSYGPALGGCSARMGGGWSVGGLCWGGRGGVGHNLRVNNSETVHPAWAVGIGGRKSRFLLS